MVRQTRTDWDNMQGGGRPAPNEGNLMKACLLVLPAPIETNPLKYMEVQRPDPAAGHVLIRVSVAAYAARICM